MRRLVILRPELGASTTLERARNAGFDTEAMPLFEIRPLPWAAPDPAGFDALILTSANTVRHGGAELAKLIHLPVHAVGEATAAAARDAGFNVASTGAGGIADLIATLPPGLRLLHLAGQNRRSAPTARSIAVYESAILPAPPDIAAVAGAVAAVHSPRAGRRLAELIEERGSIAIAAISAAAAEACGAGWERIEVADTPDDASLLALAARLCNNPGQ